MIYMKGGEEGEKIQETSQRIEIHEFILLQLVTIILVFQQDAFAIKTHFGVFFICD